MKTRRKSSSIAIWLFAVVLFVCVAATTIAYFDVMKNYMPDDDGAISLQQSSVVFVSKDENIADSSTNPPNDSPSADDGEASVNIGNTDGGETSSDSAYHDNRDGNAEFDSYDNVKVWGTNTKVEFFRVSYENSEGKITVQSADGTNVIAPGTSNTYIFKLKNTDNVALDYNVELNVAIEPNDGSIPLTARLSRHDGAWIAGDDENFIPAEQLDSAEDNATLGAGKYTYYVLEWNWPFEGDNIRDTNLGNLTVESEMSFAIEIITSAMESSDPNADSGLTPPPTGDNTRVTMWITLSAGAFVIIVVLLIIDRKEKKEKAQEAQSF